MNKDAGILPGVHIADIQFLDHSLVPQLKSLFQAHSLLMTGVFESISMTLAWICGRKYTRVCQCRPYHIAIAHLPCSPSWESVAFVFPKYIFPSEQGWHVRVFFFFKYAWTKCAYNMNKKHFTCQAENLSLVLGVKLDFAIKFCGWGIEMEWARGPALPAAVRKMPVQTARCGSAV